MSPCPVSSAHLFKDSKFRCNALPVRGIRSVYLSTIRAENHIWKSRRKMITLKFMRLSFARPIFSQPLTRFSCFPRVTCTYAPPPVPTYYPNSLHITPVPSTLPQAPFALAPSAADHAHNPHRPLSTTYIYTLSASAPPSTLRHEITNLPFGKRSRPLHHFSARNRHIFTPLHSLLPLDNYSSICRFLPLIGISHFQYLSKKIIVIITVISDKITQQHPISNKHAPFWSIITCRIMRIIDFHPYFL